jgi:hypothetical protein
MPSISLCRIRPQLFTQPSRGVDDPTPLQDMVAPYVILMTFSQILRSSTAAQKSRFSLSESLFAIYATSSENPDIVSIQIRSRDQHHKT